MRKTIFFISNQFPNLHDPHMATFNRQQIVALSQYLDVVVVAPVPWYRGLSNGSVGRHTTIGEIPVYHPVYYYLPKVAQRWQGRFLLASISALMRHLVTLHRPDAIYSSWLYPDGWAAAMVARKFRLPLFLKVHGTDVNRLTDRHRLRVASLWAVEQAEKVFCVSQALKDRLAQMGANSSRLAVVYNGVDRGLFSPLDRAVARSRLGVEHGDPILLYVGNLKQSKGVRELAETFGLLKRRKDSPRCRLVFVGKGDEKERLRSILDNYGVLSDVWFDGSSPPHRVSLWMNAANVLCLPSYMEGVPNVILEAFACRLPVVATGIGGVPEIANFGNIDLVPPRDVESLLAAVQKKLAQHEIIHGSVHNISSWSFNAQQLCQLMFPEMNQISQRS